MIYQSQRGSNYRNAAPTWSSFLHPFFFSAKQPPPDSWFQVRIWGWEKRGGAFQSRDKDGEFYLRLVLRQRYYTKKCMCAWWNIMLEEGEEGAKDGKWSGAAVRVSVATRANAVTRLKEERVSLLRNVYFSPLAWKKWVCEGFSGSVLPLTAWLNADLKNK